jgi:hypothetical protein
LSTKKPPSKGPATADTENGAKRTLVLASLARRHDISDDGLREHYQASAAKALDRAIKNQLDHVSRGSAQNRTTKEHDDGQQEQGLASD